MSITIYGYSSFKEWADAGYPGAVNGDTGERKQDDRPPLSWMRYPKIKSQCLVRNCERIEERRGLCYLHVRSARQREKVSA